MAEANEHLIDIVDDQENVLHQATKQEAYRSGLLHRTVISELINSKGEWIMVKQSADRQDPGRYVSPMGGHVMTGETNEDALKREVLEELDIKDFEYKFVGRAVYRRQVREKDENHYFILYEAFSDQEPILNEESVSYKKFTKEEIKRALKETPEQFGAALAFVVETFYPDLL